MGVEILKFLLRHRRILILEEQKENEPRTSSQSPAHYLRSSQRSSVAFLIRCGDGADQTPALISLVESRVPLILKMVAELRRSRRDGAERAGEIDIQYKNEEIKVNVSSTQRCKKKKRNNTF